MNEQLGLARLVTIAVIQATLALLLWERLTADMAAAAVPLFSGVLTPAQALAGFWNRGVLTVEFLFVLVAALKTTGAIRSTTGCWAAQWRTARAIAAGRHRRATERNNTPIVAMMT